MSDVTRDEVIEIVTGFLLNAPPGEFMEVVTDVRGLLSDESILNSSAPATFREYNTDQLLEVSSPAGGHKVLITKEGEVNNGEYVDPKGNCVLQFDHIRQEVTGQRSPSGNEIDRSVEDYRSAIEAELEKYCKQHYQSGAVTVYGKKEGGGQSITICLSSFKFNSANFWNGRWRSQWTAKISGGKVDLTGRLRVNVHYYEDGNVQLTTDTPRKANVGGGNPQTTAANIAATIKKVEQDFHQKLEISYATLSDTTFKALRRILPITRTKVEWPKIQTYRMGNELGK